MVLTHGVLFLKTRNVLFQQHTPSAATGGKHAAGAAVEQTGQ